MKIIDTFCLWCDLLGYGSPFINTNWNLHSEEARKNFQRVTKLQYLFRSIGFYPIEKSLILNDGFIRSVDVVDFPQGIQGYIYWLNSILDNFNVLNSVDQEGGFPGVRGVLTYGQRFEYMNDSVTAGDIVQTSPERKKKYEKLTLIYSPKEFQMNTAFSKAYIIENSGSRAGIYGSNLYIDYMFLNEFKELIENSKTSKYLRIDSDPGYDDQGNEIFEIPVSFKVRMFEDTEYFHYEILHYLESTNETLVKIWFEKQPVEYSDKGINTKLYRVIKYKPYDEEDTEITF